MKQVLVYNNRTKTAEKMEPLFAGEGIGVLKAESTEQLFDILRVQEIHLILVDVELNDKGWGREIELIAGLREAGNIPLIVVSAQCAETAKIMALNAGADDYVTVDCNPLELLARAKSRIRRYIQMMDRRQAVSCVYQADGLVLDDTRHTVTVEGRDVRLTPTEYKILRLLVQQRGKVFSNSQIYESIWCNRAIGTDNIIAVHVRHIREKIEHDPGDPVYLKAVWGNGYMVG